MAHNFKAAITRLEADAPDAGSQVLSVRDQIAAIERGDYGAAMRGACEDVQLDIFAPPEFHFVRRARNKGEFEKALATNFSAVTQQTPEITNVISQGDTLVLIGKERGVIVATGKPYEVQFVHRFTFRDGGLANVLIIAAYAE